MEKEGLNSAFKMEDITVMGAAELFPHMFRIWVCFLNSSIFTNLAQRDRIFHVRTKFLSSSFWCCLLDNELVICKKFFFTTNCLIEMFVGCHRERRSGSTWFFTNHFLLIIGLLLDKPYVVAIMNTG